MPNNVVPGNVASIRFLDGGAPSLLKCTKLTVEGGKMCAAPTSLQPRASRPPAARPARSRRALSRAHPPADSEFKSGVTIIGKVTIKNTGDGKAVLKKGVYEDTTVEL